MTFSWLTLKLTHLWHFRIVAGTDPAVNDHGKDTERTDEHPRREEHKEADLRRGDSFREEL